MGTVCDTPKQIVLKVSIWYVSGCIAISNEIILYNDLATSSPRDLIVRSQDERTYCEIAIQEISS